jgi:hypothetical protein
MVERGHGGQRLSFHPEQLKRLRQALCYGLYMRSAERNRNGGYSVCPP